MRTKKRHDCKILERATFADETWLTGMRRTAKKNYVGVREWWGWLVRDGADEEKEKRGKQRKQIRRGRGVEEENGRG